ncbi:MAG: amidohydrolase [Actinobacteria bacterium]|nr:MAG: amidohydrolase [Actinomycetota bacterium]
MGATTQWPFDLISADSQFTEPSNLWLEHIEPQFRDRAPHVEHHEDTDVFICDTGEMFALGMIHGVRYKGGDVVLNGRYSDIPPSGWDPDARLLDMKLDGISAEILYPTIAMRFFTIEDVPFGNACIRAYNSWAASFCAAKPDNFKAIAMIYLDDVGSAVEELERCKSLGLVGAMISVHPDGAEAYHAGSYDPFWAAAERLHMPVSLHTATERRVQQHQTPTDAFLHYTLVQRTLIGMIYAGTFDRFPGLQVVSVENDVGWAGNIVERMDYVDVKGRFRNLNVGHLNALAPSHYWHNNISYTFMRDRAGILCREIIGVDRMMWSSDFPHGDSTWPDSLTVIDDTMSDIPMADAKMILHDNAARLYGFKSDS